MNNLLLADMSNATVWGTFLIVVLVIFLVIFFAIIAKFFKTWLRARLAKAPVSMGNMLGMWLRKDFHPVVVHEFGHSFGGLADEYAYTEAPSPQYPYEVEPWEPNITTLIDFDSKWKDMIPKGTAIPTPVADRKSTRLNSSHSDRSRMPSSA